jgi:hypothetical protein
MAGSFLQTGEYVVPRAIRLRATHAVEKSYKIAV